MSKTQSNRVAAELPGALTRRQVENTLRELYRSVLGQELEDDMLPFWKSKYLQLDANDERFRAYLRAQLRLDASIAAAPARAQVVAARAQVASTPAASSAQRASGRAPGARKPVLPDAEADTRSGGDTTEAVALLRQAGASNALYYKPNIYTGTGSEHVGKAQGWYDAGTGAVNTSKVMSDLKRDLPLSRGEVRQCHARQVADARSRQVADAVSRRNSDELAMNCKRTSRYLHAEHADGMGLRSQFVWAVPMARPPVCYTTAKQDPTPQVEQTSLLGTLLTDADKTRMGWILPPQPHPSR